jgi:hypothetical protein
MVDRVVLAGHRPHDEREKRDSYSVDDFRGSSALLA